MAFGGGLMSFRSACREKGLIDLPAKAKNMFQNSSSSVEIKRVRE